MYWIYGNKTHAVLVETDADTGPDDKPTQEALDEAFAKAVEKFKAAKKAPRQLILLTYFTAEELEEADGPSDLFIPDSAMIEAARKRRSSDDLSIDEDAVLSGWNVQAWQYISPTNVVEWMLQADPLPRDRGLDREKDLKRQYEDRAEQVAKELSSVITSDGLEPYVVVYRLEDATLVFHCQADSPEHADEQLYDAEPQAVPVCTTRGLSPAIRDAISRASAAASRKP